MFEFNPGDQDGIQRVTVAGELIGEVLTSTPRVWNVAENRPDTITFCEAVAVENEFLEYAYRTREAAAAALLIHTRRGSL